MTENTVGKLIKELREDDTQQQLAFELGVVRETVSKYETGRSQVPPDITLSLMKKYDNPKFAMTVRSEYTGTGPRWLDGPNVDLHRSSVREKTIEELQEALNALMNTSLARPIKLLNHFDLPTIKSMLHEIIEAITASDHMVSIICMETGLSYTELWNEHYKDLQREGLIGGTE